MGKKKHLICIPEAYENMPRRARANVSHSKASLGITRFDFEDLQRPGIILLKVSYN